MKQPQHKQQNQAGFINNAQGFAFFAALLVILVSIPQLWNFSAWLSWTVLLPQFGEEITMYLVFAVFFVVLGAAFYLARMSLGSSIVMIAVMIATKII